MKLIYLIVTALVIGGILVITGIATNFVFAFHHMLTSYSTQLELSVGDKLALW